MYRAEGPLWLIGMMGSGKTTVAPLVAATVGREWVDADDLVVARTGRSIDALFAESEALFRDAEVEALRSLADKPVVVAAGGGAVTGAGGAVMAGSGLVVWLRASAEELRRRLADDDTRPLLRGRHSSIEELIDQRAPLYETCADHVVDTEGAAPERVAEMVVETWIASAE